MNGIDISSWQADINLANVDVDFCIVKATQGVSYVNPSCDKHVQQAINKGIPWGFYHFADGGSAEDEARFFYQACNGYIGHGIPVLDYEIYTYNDAQWCESFMESFHKLSKVWPIIYISASRCPNFADSWIPRKCGLWLAGYPQDYTSWIDGNMPYTIAPWDVCAMWQFTSSLRIAGYAGNLDGNVAYMDAAAWAKYAGCEKPSESSKVQPTLSYRELVLEIYLGEWGNGADRKRMLTNAGYDYDTVQAMVNQYDQLADEIIAGKWGNGWNRKNALESSGLDYDLAQAIVNRKMEV